jgi:putative colanic acid biosynthesis glycosyltransferase
MKLISIITICRNNLEELKLTYKSISNQTFRDFEWIVIDGDSTDGTKEWLRNNKIAEWVSEKDKGIFDAMNKGLEKSTGRFLIFMNSGDCLYEPDTLKKIKDVIDTRNYPGFIYGDSIDIDEKGSEFRRKARHFKKNRIGMITQHQAMVFNRKAIRDTRYLMKYSITADYAFVSEIIGSLDKSEIVYLNEPVCKFSMGGINEIKRFKALKEDFDIRRKIMKLPLPTCYFLYLLHYIHTVLKKSNPTVRFLRHEQVRNKPEK